MTTLYKHYLYMVASIVLSSMAQLAMKAGMLLLHDGAHQMMSLSGLVNSPAPVLWVMAGLVCYAISLLFWMSAIARLELSYAYPMLSLSYVLVYITAANWPLLNESFSLGRSLGILIVIAGVVLVTRSEPGKQSAYHD